MQMLNRLTIIGHVEYEPAFEENDANTWARLKIPVVVTERHKEREFTERFQAIVYGDRARHLKTQPSLVKGAAVMVEGPIHRGYLVAKTILFLDPKPPQPIEEERAHDENAPASAEGVAAP